MILKNRSFFFLILTACLLATYVTADRLSLHWLTAPLLIAFFLSFPTYFLPNKIRLVVQFLLGEIVIVLCVVDCFCQSVVGVPITPQLYATTLMTNMREAEDFLCSFIGWGLFKYWRLTLLLLLMITFPVMLMWNKSCSIGLQLFGIRGSKRLQFFGWALFLACALYEARPTYRFLQLFNPRKDVRNIEGLIFRHYHEEVPTPIHRFLFAHRSAVQTERELASIKQKTFVAEVDSCKHLSPHIVLVLGESYNKHHSSLYGYHLPTTPRQEERMKQGELFAFENVVTPWNITSNVFQLIFSMWQQTNEDAYCDYPLFPILFRRAGYQVRFFSNQFLLRGFRKGETNQAGHFFLADSELSDSLFTYRNKRTSKFDMGLVYQVAQYWESDSCETYTLDIIHLVGQHFDYSKRHPVDYTPFSLKDYVAKELPEKDRKTVMHYDNATSYNDLVLDSILTLYEKDEAIVLFVADHGEEVFDDRPISGRQYCDPTASIAHFEFEVPMWIWCSLTYQSKHPEIIERIKSALKRPLVTDALPHVLLSLAGISCQWYDSTSDILSPNFQQRSRIIAGGSNYDTLVKRDFDE